MLRTALLGLALSTLTACDLVDSSELDLEGRRFIATNIEEAGAPYELVEGTQLSLNFNEDDWLGANAGCNSFSAEYTVDDDVLILDGGAWTEMGCDPERHDQDDWYFGFLMDAEPELTLDGDSLTLDGGDIVIDYLDEEVATPDLDLVGTTWTVDTLIDGKAATTTPKEVAQLVFADDGTGTVETGCNSGSFSWSEGTGVLQFADLVVTDAACPNDQAQGQEDIVVGVLGAKGEVTFEIQVDRLTLDEGSVGLGLLGS